MLTSINTLLNDNEIQWITGIQYLSQSRLGFMDWNREQTMTCARGADVQQQQ